MNLEFSGEMWFWKGPAPWHFITVPEEECGDLEAASVFVTYGWGMTPVYGANRESRVEDVAVPERQAVRHYALPLGVPSCSAGASIGGGPMTSADEIRDVQRAAWAGLSAGWEKWDSVIMDQLCPVGAAIVGRLGIAEDQQHLDIAAGTGEPGLSIARLSPKGRVVLTDLVPEMLDVAARRARAQGIANIVTKVCSADDLPFSDAAFDSVSVRFGYMFFPDVARATAEFARVLRPGERLCSSVWARPGENPWTAIAMQAIATEAVVAPPD